MNFRWISYSFLPFCCYAFMIYIGYVSSSFEIQWEYAFWYLFLLCISGLLSSSYNKYGELLLFFLGLTVLIIGINLLEAGMYEMIVGLSLMGYSLWLYHIGDKEKIQFYMNCGHKTDH